MNMKMRMVVVLAAFTVSLNACVIVVDDVDGAPELNDGELLFGPDEHCPGECVNPADETCYHLPGGCGRGDDDDDDDDEDDEDDDCDPCVG
jgi:hypothetical protein